MNCCMTLLSMHYNVLNNWLRLVVGSLFVNHSPAPLHIFILLCLILLLLHIETRICPAHSVQNNGADIKVVQAHFSNSHSVLGFSNPFSSCCNKAFYSGAPSLTNLLQFLSLQPTPPASRSESIPRTTRTPRRLEEVEIPLQEIMTRLDMTGPKKSLNRPKKRTLVRWDGMCLVTIPDVEFCPDD